MLFRSHTLRKLVSPNPANRRSGWTSLISFSSMALSGYLLQVVASPAWLTVFTWLHISTGLIFVIGYAVHLVIGWRLSQASLIASDTGLPRATDLPL